MGHTMTEKILARASGLAEVHPGDVVLADVDLLAMSDSERFIDLFEAHGLKIWDPKKVVFSFDHYYGSQMKSSAASVHPRLLQFAEKYGIPPENMYHHERRGISHHVPVEEGFALPGKVSPGADTQAATMGVANGFSIPTLSSGTTSVILTGKLWAVVPECVQLNLTGALPKGVLGKDLVYWLMRDLKGTVAGRVIEVTGPGVASLPIDMRMSIANGAVQIGALTVIFPFDAVLQTFLANRARGPYEPVAPDPDARYEERYDYDLSTLEPLVSGPHDIDLIRPLRDLVGLDVDAAYIGSCSSGRFEDMALAAEVLRGRRISERVRLVVTPISGAVRRRADEAGLTKIFEDAGAIVTDPGCGACYHGNISPLKLADKERCISSSVETVPGRMGSTDAEIYLGNAAVVAASALEGRIADPKKYLLEGRS